MAVNDIPAQHAGHDELRIVAFAAGDLEGDELNAASALIATCGDCARLADNVALIQTATARLPAPRRRRDFRLTEADAVRLRPPGWRRFLVRLASPGFAFTQPLAAGLATIGLAGLLVTTIPGLLTGFAGSAASPADRALVEMTSKAPAPEAPEGAAPTLAAPAAEPSPVAGAAAGSQAPDASPVPAPADAAATEGATLEAAKGLAQNGVAERGAAGGFSPVVLGSLLLLIGGVGLFLLRWSARRLTDG